MKMPEYSAAHNNCKGCRDIEFSLDMLMARLVRVGRDLDYETACRLVLSLPHMFPETLAMLELSDRAAMLLKGETA